MYLIIDYQIGLDIDNCVTFFINPEANLLARLRRDYDGICFNGNLILHVLKVIRTGECVLNNPTNPTIGSLDVIFRAVAINYSPNDIVAGCVVRPIRENERITMTSEYANVMIVQTKENQDIAILTADTIVTIRVTETLAYPGFSRISLWASLYEPLPITYYYPIIPGTQNSIISNESVTRAKYVSQQDINLMATNPDADIQGLSILEAARQAAEYLATVLQDVGSQQAMLPSIIRQLFYPFQKQTAPPPKVGDSPLVIQDLLELHVPPDATCFVACAELNPLETKIGISSAPLSELPQTWVQGELAQSAGVIVTRRLEKFIDYAIAGATMARAFIDPAKLTASKNLIVLQSKKKK